MMSGATRRERTAEMELPRRRLKSFLIHHLAKEEVERGSRSKIVSSPMSHEVPALIAVLGFSDLSPMTAKERSTSGSRVTSFTSLLVEKTCSLISDIWIVKD